MYTRAQFGKELKERILKKQATIDIGLWAFSMYWEHIEDIDDRGFDRVLLALGAMELGEEFAFTYERLNEIADTLIDGKDVVNLDY